MKRSLPLILSLPLTTTSQTIPSSSCPPQNLWSYTLKTDDYPWETSWQLQRRDDDAASTTVQWGPLKGTYDRRSTYADSSCLPAGSYTLILRDVMGDGFCCTYGRGRWVMRLGDEAIGRIVNGGKFAEIEMNFVVDDDPTEEAVDGFDWVEAVAEEEEAMATEMTTDATEAATASTLTTTTTPEITTTTTTTEEEMADATIASTEDAPVTTAATTTATAIDETTTVIAIEIEVQDDAESPVVSNVTDSPTSSPSSVADLWANYNPRHSKFCGPKIVGGYAIAISQCGPTTVCGLSTTSDHYGASGNDCPKGLMCYSDISCNASPPDSIPLSGRVSQNDDQVVEVQVNNDGLRTNGDAKTTELSFLKQEEEIERVVNGNREFSDVDGAASGGCSFRVVSWVGWVLVCSWLLVL